MKFQACSVCELFSLKVFMIDAKCCLQDIRCFFVGISSERRYKSRCCASVRSESQDNLFRVPRAISPVNLQNVVRNSRFSHICATYSQHEHEHRLAEGFSNRGVLGLGADGAKGGVVGTVGAVTRSRILYRTLLHGVQITALVEQYAGGTFNSVKASF